LTEKLDLLRLKRFTLGWHPVILFRGDHAMKDFTFFQVTGSYGRKSGLSSLVGEFSKVQTQSTLWIIQSMTGKAML
jgi:hypothetical protein